MKYILLVTRGDRLSSDTEFERHTVSEKVIEFWAAMYVGGWTNGPRFGKLINVHQLQSSNTAMTVLIDKGKCTVLPGPMVDDDKTIDRLGILEAADLDVALAVVKTMPLTQAMVEVRPVVERAPAGESDGQAVGRALDKHRLALNRGPRELVGDRGYGSQVAVQACVTREVQPLLGVRTPTNPHGGLDRSEFTYVAESDLYICPKGKQLRRAGENYNRHQTMYKIAKGACRECPLKPQ